MNSNAFSKVDPSLTKSPGAESISIALVCADDQRRRSVSSTLAELSGTSVLEYSCYPPSFDDVPEMLRVGHDAIMIDLDSEREYALGLIEKVCAGDAATVIVLSETTNSDLLLRCMRAGAREFLPFPLSQSAVEEAIARASARRPLVRPPAKRNGKLLAFLGAKGGVGVTTIASNYAVALAQDQSQRTLLIDLDLPLGDAVLNLGLVPEYSTFNALQDFSRLDSSFLAKLLVKHSSGLSVLAAPGKLPQFIASDEATDRLLTIARQDFDHVVVDIGSRLDLINTSLFRAASTIYLVTQASISELRNSNRLISHLSASWGSKLEIVINRYESRSLLVDDEQIRKALTRPVNWKVPNDHAAVRKMQSTATPLVLTDSHISRQIRLMADSLKPKPEAPARKTRFKLFG